MIEKISQYFVTRRGFSESRFRPTFAKASAGKQLNLVAKTISPDPSLTRGG